MEYAAPHQIEKALKKWNLFSCLAEVLKRGTAWYDEPKNTQMVDDIV